MTLCKRNIDRTDIAKRSWGRARKGEQLQQNSYEVTKTKYPERSCLEVEGRNKQLNTEAQAVVAWKRPYKQLDPSDRAGSEAVGMTMTPLCDVWGYLGLI